MNVEFVNRFLLKYTFEQKSWMVAISSSLQQVPGDACSNDLVCFTKFFIFVFAVLCFIDVSLLVVNRIKNYRRKNV